VKRKKRVSDWKPYEQQQKVQASPMDRLCISSGRPNIKISKERKSRATDRVNSANVSENGSWKPYQQNSRSDASIYSRDVGGKASNSISSYRKKPLQKSVKNGNGKKFNSNRSVSLGGADDWVVYQPAIVQRKPPQSLKSNRPPRPCPAETRCLSEGGWKPYSAVSVSEKRLKRNRVLQQKSQKEKFAREKARIIDMARKASQTKKFCKACRERVDGDFCTFCYEQYSSNCPSKSSENGEHWKPYQKVRPTVSRDYSARERRLRKSMRKAIQAYISKPNIATAVCEVEKKRGISELRGFHSLTSFEVKLLS